MNFKKNLSLWILILVVAFIGASIFSDRMKSDDKKTKEVAFSDIVKMAESGALESVVVIGDRMIVKPKGGEEVFAYGINDPELLKTLKEKNARIEIKPEDAGGIRAGDVFLTLLPIGIIIGFWYLMYRSAGSMNNKAMGFGKAKAKTMTETKSKVTFADVAGVEEAKEEVTEIVDYLKEPEKFQRLGGRIPRGVLMVGAPGTGKTLLARAIAGEAGVPFLTISGSDFVEMFVGVGASRVRSLFEQAKKQAPCIVFVDEIDAVGRHRGAGLGGGNDEREQTLNQLLVEMDGFDDNTGVILIAATNRPDVLDPALLRPGRFDRQVVVALPDLAGREKILEVHLKKVQMSDDVNVKTLARGTPGFSGADLANLVNEAALIAARRSKRFVGQSDFEYARDKVMMGAERRTHVISDEEKKNTAYHEAGHAICMIHSPAAHPIHKATIIPRGFALGMVQPLPERDQNSITKQQLETQMVVCFGGRIAEEMTFGKEKITTGASHDLKMATSYARKMVTQWGMNEEIGVVVHEEPEGNVFLGYEIARRKNTSDKTAEKVDLAIKKLVDAQYQKAKRILHTHKKELDRLAKALLEYETLTGDEIKEVIKGKRLNKEKENYGKREKRKSLPDMKGAVDVDA